jgi:cobalt-zinc-cadmium efflux system outer membrane protein
MRTGVAIVVVIMHALALTVVADAQTLQPGPSSAASYVDPVGGLTLNDAMACALEHEPGLRASRAQIDMTRGLREQAALRPNPSVSFFQQQEPGGADNQTRVELQWPLDLFRKTGRVEVADREVEVAQHAVADRERTLVAEVRFAYGQVAAAVRTLTVSEQLLAATNRQLMLISSRVEQGAAPPLDRDMVRVEVQRLEAERSLQVGAVEGRLVELKRLLGIGADASLTLRTGFEELVREEMRPGASPPQSAALTTRPDVLEAEARVRVAEAQIDRAQREGRPDMSLFGMYMRMDAGFPQQGFSSTGALQPIRSVFHYVSVGAMVTLPVVSRNQGAVAAAGAERTGAAARVEAARLSVQSEIAAARSRDEHARRALDAYSADAIALARRNLVAVRQTYDLGRGTLLDVLNEQRRYLDVERAYTDVLREAYEAHEMLKAALGDVR